jgi:hypothetical protein
MSESRRPLSSYLPKTSVADEGCLYRIRIFSSRIRIFFRPGSRIRIKEFKYFKPKKLFLRCRKYVPGCSSRIRILIFYHQDPGVKKAPDPGSGSATLPKTTRFESNSARYMLGTYFEIAFFTQGTTGR